MVVSITWSLSSGGSSTTDIDSGQSSNGSTTTNKEVFLRHDGANSITGCAFYFTPKTGTYSGAQDAATDFTELIGWGDALTADGFGGIQICMREDFGDGDFELSETKKTSEDGLKYTVRTGVADSSANAVTLAVEMSASMVTPGVIPAGATASFAIRMQVPTDEDVNGIRQFDQVLKFSWTS